MSSTPSLVLRTLYISPELDNKLRAEAYDRRTSKNDVIRGYLEYAIEQKKKEASQKAGTTFVAQSTFSATAPSKTTSTRKPKLAKVKAAAKKAAVRKVAAKKVATRKAAKKNT